MANVNKVILIGNVTRDPEVKFTSKGSAVADLGLAINRNYTLDNGEKREETTFVDVELWGRLAEIAGEYAKKAAQSTSKVAFAWTLGMTKPVVKNAAV